MNIMRIERLLSEITNLYKLAEKDKLERIKQGDFFNVFNTIGLRTEEVRLHSAFIAELLNPQGSHGLSNLFLQAFLKQMELPCDYVTEAKGVIKERYIGRKTKKEGGRIDIIIEDGNHAVIIENKIYAEDQGNQLLRYYNYGRKQFPKGFELVYLTLDGVDPDEKSLGKKDLPFNYMSYKDDIVEWLEECVVIAQKNPLVEAVIIQYRELVKQITNTDMDTSYKEQLLETMLKPDNAIAMGEMLAVEEDWFSQIMDIYIWKPLKEYAESKNMEIGKDVDSGEETGLWIYKNEWKYYGIFVWTDSKRFWNDMYFCISYYNKPNRSNLLTKKEYKKLDCLEEEAETGCPYGWEYLREDIRNWNYSITKEIVTKEVANYIIEKFEMILNEIEEKKIKMP